MSPKKPTLTEHQIQCQIVAEIRLKYPDVIIYAVPNGGLRNVVVAKKLKAEGVLPGVPDLVIADPRLWFTEGRIGGYAGLYLELKRKNGKPTDIQRDIMQKLIGKGYQCRVADSVEKGVNEIESYLKLYHTKIEVIK